MNQKDQAAYNRRYYLKHQKRIRKYQKAYRKVHPEAGKNRERTPEARIKTRTWQDARPERMAALAHAWHVKNAVRAWAAHTIHGHRRRGYEVNITTDELHQLAEKKKCCFYCGTELMYGFKAGKQLTNSPSLDRINNGRILNMENIQIICRSCNTTKGPRTHLEFMAYCKRIAGMPTA